MSCPVPDNEITTQVLVDLRAEIHAGFQGVNQRLDGIDRRLDEIDRRLDNSNKHLVATDARLSTEVSAVRGAAQDHEDKQNQLDDRVSNCEREIDELKKREP